MPIFTRQVLQEIFPHTPTTVLAAWVNPLNDTLERFEINTPARAAAFIAQVGHESADLTTMAENLNYSADGLRRTWPRHFPTDALAARYARKPQMIANRAYANRMGNGDETSGDGYVYRGRGLIMCTGRSTYQALATSLGKTLPETVTYLETREGAAMSAGWFWSSRGLNALADQGRFTDITKRINGGVIGLDARKALWAKAKATLD